MKNKQNGWITIDDNAGNILERQKVSLETELGFMSNFWNVRYIDSLWQFIILFQPFFSSILQILCVFGYSIFLLGVWNSNFGIIYVHE